MQTTNFDKRIYTPQFSEEAAVTVKRLSWYLNIPMTKTVDIIIKELALIFSPKDVCPKCKDKKCSICAFGKLLATTQQAVAA